MKLLYSGAAQSNVAQINPLQSVGGLISSTPIPNGGLNAIFPPISRNDLKTLNQDIRLIVLYNETDAAVDLNIWTIRGTYSSYQIAAVSPGINKCGNPEFETVQDGISIPYQATLATHETEVDTLEVGTVAAGAYVGVWIQRTIDTTQFTELDGLIGAPCLTDTQMIALLQAQQTGTNFDQGQLFIDFV